jgi:putative hydrolase of the HAD superfamily
MPPKFWYFDLGNVLLKFCNDTAMRQMADLADFDAEELRTLLLGPSERESIQWQYERGDISTDTYIGHYRQFTGHSPDLGAFSRAASDMFAPIAESFALVEHLHAAGHRLGILSNTNPLHWAFVTDGRYPQLNFCFEQNCTSFAANSMKPEARIYQHAILLAGVPAAQVFFTDDRLENVEGARAVGIDAVLFTSTEQLRNDLRSRGIDC